LEAHAYWRRYFSYAQRRRLLNEGFADAEDGADDLLAPSIEAASSFHGLNQFLAFDTMSYLPSDMLYKVDIATMMHSLEARVPLLDHELVELAFSLKADLKRRRRQGKWILKAALAQMLPFELPHGSKRGLNVPIARWLAGPLAARLDEVLDPASRSVTELFDLSYLHQLRREHHEKRADHSHKLWAVVAFVVWYDAARRVS
jgi:asparagine synthase (glutamine-hydrolysing)